MVEASAFTHQKDVITQLVDAGRELMLDTNVAELSAVGRYGGAAKSAPWAHSEGPLQPEHFARGSNHDVIGKIARFAVEHGFHAVQAPTHLLEGSTDAWFGIDRQACEDLRRALDVAGGGGRRLLGCQDRACCPNGHNDTLKDPKGHYLCQRTKPLERLSRVPAARRVDDFLKHDLDPAGRIAETATRLALADAKTAEMLQRTNERLARLGPVLRDLHATVGDGSHARAPTRRGNRAAGARTARQ